MVISSTSAVDVSIHAVSPEFIFAPSTSSGLVGAGGGAAAGAAAAGAAAGAAAAGAAAAGAASAGFASAGFASAAGAAGLSCAMTGAARLHAPNNASRVINLFIMHLPIRSEEHTSEL